MGHPQRRLMEVRPRPSSAHRRTCRSGVPPRRSYPFNRAPVGLSGMDIRLAGPPRTRRGRMKDRPLRPTGGRFLGCEAPPPIGCIPRPVGDKSAGIDSNPLPRVSPSAWVNRAGGDAEIRLPTCRTFFEDRPALAEALRLSCRRFRTVPSLGRGGLLRLAISRSSWGKARACQASVPARPPDAAPPRERSWIGPARPPARGSASSGGASSGGGGARRPRGAIRSRQTGAPLRGAACRRGRGRRGAPARQAQQVPPFCRTPSAVRVDVALEALEQLQGGSGPSCRRASGRWRAGCWPPRTS